MCEDEQCVLVRGSQCGLEEREDIHHKAKSHFFGSLEYEFISWTGLWNVYRKKKWLSHAVATPFGPILCTALCSCLKV